MPLNIGRSSYVAVVDIHGIIGSQVRVTAYARLLDEIANNKRYRALLLDIDSPGGSAYGSEILHRALQRVAEVKPVLAYVRGLGASGGYYLCCAASQVFALPTSMVGSIGVIYLRPALEQLLARIGVEFSVFKGGKYKDMAGFWRGPTPEESERFQQLIDEIYENFVSVVANGRSMDKESVRELATGEIHTGLRGKELGLVDQIGDFNDTLDAAAAAGRTKPRPRWVQPRRSLAQRVLGRAGGGRFDETLTAGLQRVLSGGIYYLEPSYLFGHYDSE